MQTTTSQEWGVEEMEEFWRWNSTRMMKALMRTIDWQRVYRREFLDLGMKEH